MSRDRRRAGGTSRPPGEPYSVGYGRPPKHSQFKNGTSGNPGGKRKPRLSPPLPDIGHLLHEILAEPTAITINGRATKTSLLEIVLKTLAHGAVKGDPRSLRELNRMLERYPAPRPEAVRSNGPSAREILMRKLNEIAERQRQAADREPKPKGREER